MRRIRWLLALLIIWLAWPQLVAAHADLIWSDPAAGGVYPIGSISHITFHFDEIIEPVFSSVEVYNSRLQRVDAGGLQVDPADSRTLIVDVAELAEDTYTVVWLVLSTVDGHSTSGLFNFSVGAAGVAPAEIALPDSTTASPGGWEVGIRWLSFVTAVTIFGSLLLVVIVLNPIRPLLDVDDTFWSQVHWRINVLALVAILLWLLAGVGALGLQTAVVGRAGLLEGVARGIPLQLLRTRFGLAWLLRQLPALALLVLHWRNPQSFDRFKTGSPIKLTLAALLFASLSLSSHGAAGQLWPTLATLVDWLHLLANGAWVGGLLVLVLAFLPALRRLPAFERQAMLRPLLRRFSLLALVSLLLVVATGVFSSSLHFLAPTDLGETAYGRVWLVKLALMPFILFLGLANAIVLRLSWGNRLPFTARWRLSHAVRIEALLGLIILLATAVLTTLPTPPPRPLDPGSIPFNSELREINMPEHGLKAFLALAPNYIGWNRYLVVLHNANGNPVGNTERVRIRFALPDVDARTDWITMSPSPDGLYVASGQDLVLAGNWQIEVDTRRAGMADARFSVAWPLAAPPAVQVDPARPRLTNWLTLVALGLTLIGLIGWNRYSKRP